MNRPANTSGSTPVSVRTGGMVKNNASLQQRSSSVGHVAKTWPPETDLVISPKRKVKLTIQQPVIRVLLKDAIESVRASLLFDNAFPDTDEALTVIRKSIFYAAERYEPGTTVILERLKCDHEYLSQMCSVVCVIFINEYITEVIRSPVHAFH